MTVGPILSGSDLDVLDKERASSFLSFPTPCHKLSMEASSFLQSSSSSSSSSLIQEHAYSCSKIEVEVDQNVAKISLDEKEMALLASEIDILEKTTNEFRSESSESSSRWGHDEINLFFHKYLLVDGFLNAGLEVNDSFGSGLKMTDKGLKSGLSVAKMVAPEISPGVDSIQQNLASVKLIQKMTTQIGCGTILIYKQMFLRKMKEMVDLNPQEMTPEEIKELKDWLKQEQTKVKIEAKKLAIKFGESLPGYTLKLLKICQINAPYLKLSLNLLDSFIDPIVAGIHYKKTVKLAAAGEKQNEQLHKDYFRHAFVTPDAEGILRTNEEATFEVGATEEMIFQNIREGATIVRDKRRATLLDKREMIEDGFNHSYEERFNRLITGVFKKAAHRQMTLSQAKRYLEENELYVDPEITTIEGFENMFNERGFFYENMLARYIDVNSGQAMTDTVRSALKTLALKKQTIKNQAASSNVTDAKINIVVKVIFSALAIILTSLAFAGIFVPPAVALFVPLLGMMAVGNLLLTIGLISFYRKQPNLFYQYLNGNVLKKSLYEIPKKINTLRKQFLKHRRRVKKIEAKIKVASLGSKQLDPAGAKKKQAKLDLLTKKIGEMKVQIKKLDTAIQRSEEKIAPIAQKIAQAKIVDFLQETPIWVRAEGRKFDYNQGFVPAGKLEEIKPLGMMKQKDANDQIAETLDALKRELLTPNSKADEEISTIFKNEWGVDLEIAQKANVGRALWAFAP